MYPEKSKALNIYNRALPFLTARRLCWRAVCGASGGDFLEQVRGTSKGKAGGWSGFRRIRCEMKSGAYPEKSKALNIYIIGRRLWGLRGGHAGGRFVVRAAGLANAGEGNRQKERPGAGEVRFCEGAAGKWIESPEMGSADKDSIFGENRDAFKWPVRRWRGGP